MCEGLAQRCKEMDFDPPEMAVVDTCCQVRAAIKKVFPDIHVVLEKIIAHSFFTHETGNVRNRAMDGSGV